MPYLKTTQHKTSTRYSKILTFFVGFFSALILSLGFFVSSAHSSGNSQPPPSSVPLRQVHTPPKRHKVAVSLARAQQRACKRVGMPKRLCLPAVRATKAAHVRVTWAFNVYVVDIIRAESSFNQYATNGTCYGLFQFQNTTWATVGLRKTSDVYTQFVGGFRYIHNRYHTAREAWNFRQSHSPNWY